jgi:tetratricopeptide (TPR) repeat protein
MDSRTSAWLLTVPLTMLCAGCLTTQAQKTVVTAAGPTATTRADDLPKVKKDEGPKRKPLPDTEIAYGKMKEGEADCDAAKQNPEAQARLRDEARQAYQHAVKLDPNNLEAYRCLGRLYTKLSDFERAQDVYKKAMAKYPKDATLWYDLGMCHSRRKDIPDNVRFGEAVRCFSKALDLDPENRDYLKKLGYTLAWTGKVDQGLIYLTRAHGPALAQFRIACMFDQKNDAVQAIHHLRLALRENSQLQEARELLTAIENPGANPRRRATLDAPVFGG